MLDGTVFRTPIVVKGIEPCVRNWKNRSRLPVMHTEMSIKMQKCAFRDQEKAELVYMAEDGTETRELIHNFTGAGVIQGVCTIWITP